MSQAAASSAKEPPREEQKRAGKLVQYLTFTLGDEEYGVDILRVQEIRSWEPVSRIPNAPPYEKGVINLRGAIVPIVDLRMRFLLGKAEYTPVTVVVVVRVQSAEKMRMVGIVVDTVSDVILMDQDNIQSSPDFGSEVNTEFICGIGSVEGRMVMLLDIDKLLSFEHPDEASDPASGAE